MGAIEDFLLARIAEDEADAAVLADPVRTQMLSTFEATRRVVAMRVRALEASVPHETVSAYDSALWDVLTVLALPYADHPDYLDGFRPNGLAVIEPALNRPIWSRASDGTVAASDALRREYLQVAVTLAQAVVAEEPATPEQWWGTSIGIIGSAWSNEMSTELILSRALLATTRLAIAEARKIAHLQLGESASESDVAKVLANAASADPS